MNPATRSRLEAELDKQKHDKGFMGSITAFSEGWRKACETFERIMCEAAPEFDARAAVEVGMQYAHKHAGSWTGAAKRRVAQAYAAGAEQNAAQIYALKDAAAHRHLDGLEAGNAKRFALEQEIEQLRADCRAMAEAMHKFIEAKPGTMAIAEYAEMRQALTKERVEKYIK